MSLLKNLKIGGLKSKHTELVLFLVIASLGIYLVYYYNSKFSKTVPVEESLGEFKPASVGSILNYQQENPIYFQIIMIRYCLLALLLLKITVL